MSGIAGKLGAVFKNYSSNDKSKLICDFQDDETWTSGAGTQTDDATNYRLGTESIKITENDGTGGLLYSDRNSASFNLNQFESADASDSSDYIYVIFYVSDATKVTNVQIGFDADATYDGTNAYTYSITSVSDGWNYVKIKKSAFSSSGSPDWSSVDSIRVGWTSTASSRGEYVSFQAVYLIDDSYDLILANKTAYIMEQKQLFTGWSVDSNLNLQEDSDLYTLKTSPAKTYTPTLREWTCTLDKFWGNGDELAELGTTVGLLLYVNCSVGYRYEGIALPNTNNVSLDKENLIAESLSFTGTTEIYYTSLQIIDS